MIKFKCGQCGQKLGVPEKYAGKAVRCTGCKEPVRVPELESEPEPVLEPITDDGMDSYDVDEPFPTDDSPLSAMAGLSGPADGMQELMPAPEASSPSGISCPNCGAEVGPQAVICIQCGNNLKSGGGTKTKVSKEKSGGGGIGINGRAIVAFMVGGIVAGIGGFIWFIIAMFGFELGILAWGIGGLTGLTVAAIYNRYSTVAGIGAAVITMGGLLLGKGLIYLLITGLTMLPDALDNMGETLMDDPAWFEMSYSEHMQSERLFDPELQAKIDALPEGEFYDDALYEEIEAAAHERVASLTEEERQAFKDEMFSFEDEEISEGFAELEDLDAWSAAFSLWDLLWFPLALGTAFSVGRGKDA